MSAHVRALQQPRCSPEELLGIWSAGPSSQPGSVFRECPFRKVY